MYLENLPFAYTTGNFKFDANGDGNKYIKYFKIQVY